MQDTEQISPEETETKIFINALTQTPLKLLSAPVYKQWNISTSVEPLKVTHKQTRCMAARRLWEKIDNLSSSPFIQSEFDAHVQEILQHRAADVVKRTRIRDLRKQFSPENLLRLEIRKQRQLDELNIPPDLLGWRKRSNRIQLDSITNRRKARSKPLSNTPLTASKLSPASKDLASILLADSRPSSSIRLRSLRPAREDMVAHSQDLATIYQRILVRNRTCPTLYDR